MSGSKDRMKKSRENRKMSKYYANSANFSSPDPKDLPMPNFDEEMFLTEQIIETPNGDKNSGDKTHIDLRKTAILKSIINLK